MKMFTIIIEWFCDISWSLSSCLAVSCQIYDETDWIISIFKLLKQTNGHASSGKKGCSPSLDLQYLSYSDVMCKMYPVYICHAPI